MTLFHASSFENYFTEQTADATEEALYRTLLSPEHYERDIRPTTHHSIATNVTFGFLLNQIVEMVSDFFYLGKMKI